MSVRTALICIVAVVITCLSCARPLRNVPSGEEGPEEAVSEAETVAQPEGAVERWEEVTTEGAGAELPFDITIGGQAVGAGRRADVMSEQPIEIELSSDENVQSEARVVLPHGSVTALGQWTGEAARFVQEFPYGESHLIVQYGESIYDFLIVAGPPEPEARCEGAYVDLNSNARWEFDETSDVEYRSHWVHHIEWAGLDASGNPQFAMIVERFGGVERKLDFIEFLDLYCRDGVIYIRRSTQQAFGTERNTDYDEGTVYLPADIAEGVSWTRHGQSTLTDGEGLTVYEVTETITCTGTEKIEIEAGEFDAAKAEYSISAVSGEESSAYSGESWYVPGLGRVLSIGQADGSRRLELISHEGVTVR